MNIYKKFIFVLTFAPGSWDNILINYRWLAQLGEQVFYKHQVIGSIPISPTNRREDRYLDGAHNPVLVGSTPTPATIGAVAHQGERIPCTDEVAGSIPVSSTIKKKTWHFPQNLR